MRLYIEDLPVTFPYSLVFNEQVTYMQYLKKTLDSTGHAILEMPTGTGKTVCLLALLTSYLSHREKYKKLIYCTRTVGQMEKTLIQLKGLLKKRQKQQPNTRKFLCLGLTAKKNLCVHKNAKAWKQAGALESQCKKRTAQWIRNKRYVEEQEGEHHLCEFYENLASLNEVIDRNPTQHQVFTMEDLRRYGRDKIQCPYYTARQGLKMADIIVFNYLYLIDPQISGSFLKNLSKDTIVVFDEAHNIDDVCIEAYTLKVNNNILQQASRNLTTIGQKLESIGQENKERYQRELQKVLTNLREKNELFKSNSVEIEQSLSLDQKMYKKFIPESIANNEMFISSLKLVMQFMRNKLKEKAVRFYDNGEFRKQMELNTNLDDQFFKMANQTLFRLLNMLQVTEVEGLKALTLVTFFCELIFTHKNGFKIVYQPHPMDGNIADPVLTLSCLDCSLSMQPIWKSFPSVILTSGTISPINLYPKILGFEPVIAKSINIQIGRNPINPLIIGRTFDQEPLSSQYTQRSETKVASAYGKLLIGLAGIVPDGILCFFPSYMYMEHILKQWFDLGIIDELMKYKYLFIEKKDVMETEDGLRKYRQACDIGRGAVYFAIARGKIAEGVDFQEHYGRCVIMMGFPVQNSHDPVLLQRIKFMVENKQLKDRNEFFEFDTMRQVAQCLGRVMRKKTDYGLMILADSRFMRPGKYEKLPQWIKRCLQNQNINITFEMIFHVSSDFFRKMGRLYQLSDKHYKTQNFFQRPQNVKEIMILPQQKLKSQQEKRKKQRKQEAEKQDVFAPGQEIII